MISSSSSLGGGTKNMFELGEDLNNKFCVYYAIPKNDNFLNFLNEHNHLEISERELNIQDILNLKKFINVNSIDIIHAHGKGAGSIARIIKLFTKKPLIYTFHGIHLKCHKRYKRYVYIFYEYLFGWLDSAKVLVSKSEKKYAKESNIFLGNQSKIINNGVTNKPIKQCNKDYRFENLNFDSNKIIVTSICRFVEQKNIKDILKIAENLPYIDFSIIGDGQLMDEIKELILKKKLKNICLHGEKKNIFKYLYSSDIYLSTSLYEGLPISVLEAMSIGLPIIASNVIGNCDTVENGKSGYLYEISNIEEGAFYVDKLAKDISLRKKIGYAAWQRQRALFSKEKMISNYLSLYKCVLDLKY